MCFSFSELLDFQFKSRRGDSTEKSVSLTLAMGRLFSKDTPQGFIFNSAVFLIPSVTHPPRHHAWHFALYRRYSSPNLASRPVLRPGVSLRSFANTLRPTRSELFSCEMRQGHGDLEDNVLNLTESGE